MSIFQFTESEKRFYFWLIATLAFLLLFAPVFLKAVPAAEAAGQEYTILAGEPSFVNVGCPEYKLGILMINSSGDLVISTEKGRIVICYTRKELGKGARLELTKLLGDGVTVTYAVCNSVPDYHFGDITIAEEFDAIFAKYFGE